VGALLALALALSACAADEVPDAASPADSLTVEVRQQRSDVAARQAQIVITNGTDADVTIGAARIDDPRFEGPAVRLHDRESPIRPGTTVALPVQLAPVACPAPDDAESTVTFVWTQGGQSGEATVAAPDPLGFIPPLHERECQAEALAAAADLSLSSFTPSPPGEPADLVLTVAPTGAASALLQTLHATNLLTFAGDAVEFYPLDVVIAEGDRAPVEVRIPLEPIRCDPHAVQEDKRGTVFTVDVELDGAPGQIQLAASEQVRGEILTWVADWCGFGP